MGKYDYTSKSVLLVDKSLPDFLRNADKIAVNQVLVRFKIYLSIPEIFAIEL